MYGFPLNIYRQCGLINYYKNKLKQIMVILKIKMFKIGE